MDSFKSEGRSVDAETPKAPKLWVDMVANLPWLRSKPFFVDGHDEKILVETVVRLGFRLVYVDLPRDAGNPEEELLKELTKRLHFSELGAGSWAAYSDRIWDLQMSGDEAPVAIVIRGLDHLLRSDVHSFVRCVHNLLSMTEAVGLSDSRADLQIEYFFVGSWSSA
ncbi:MULTISPECIES: hypothetical protein [Pseudofrankia]|uniref:hypothetical protein n=1 Tax=Pseudofrankia TaxID=2994363 RepID=UPI001042242D|nr:MULTISPECIES: hypothetical protein [Pseudofrankia]